MHRRLLTAAALLTVLSLLLTTGTRQLPQGIRLTRLQQTDTQTAPSAVSAISPAAASDVSDAPSTGLTATSDGLYTFNGVDTRHGPQCVEYAERYYVTRYPGTFPLHNSGPGAYDIWEGIANNKNIGGWPTHRHHFIAYPNGTTLPQPEDMLLYNRTRGHGYGHIAIITQVHPTSLLILEQNHHHNTLRLLPLVGGKILDDGVQGVIRLKQNDHQESNTKK